MTADAKKKKKKKGWEIRNPLYLHVSPSEEGLPTMPLGFLTSSSPRAAALELLQHATASMLSFALDQGA